jgi:Protein of unknown function (DUF3141)
MRQLRQTCEDKKMPPDLTLPTSVSSLSAPASSFVSPGAEYMIDAAQRGILFLDTLRQRGNQRRQHLARTAPNVLDFDVEMVVDGRNLDRPVNYILARIIPPAGVEIDLRRRPFVVVDPRAGHGPGIGGFKPDSEIGVALKAGHSCYFIGFLPDPVPGQTIEDIAHAEAAFLEKVIALHPQADGKPCVVGNCQAGWAVMMLAAIRPELFGPIIVAGSPLSYWAGIRGRYPMRYSGGLLGGSWLTALLSDLGRGKFDGAWLVQNFENQNPANTLWSKQYNLYAKVDSEAPRYLEFERWWGGHVDLNAEEIQFIVDELFVGNKLAAGLITTSDGTTVDLRNIRTPIVVFCSKGDNITPPQQALGWILDLYEDVDEIRSYGQTIVYTIHESAGHLGIFVSGGVAKKEHGEFSSNIDLIDTLPPGLYEGVIENKSADMTGSDLVAGNWVMRCEARSLDDIRALGGNDAADERRFATAARVSETNLALYRTFAQPAVRSMMSSQLADLMHKWHPMRLAYEIFSDANPFMAPVAMLAEHVRRDRRPAAADNPFIAMQESASARIVAALDSWRDANEAIAEKLFLSVYGSPTLQAAVGTNTAAKRPPRRAADSPLHRELLQARIAELKSRISAGGLRAAAVRGLLYVGMGRGVVDERGFELTRRLRQAHGDLSLGAFKLLVREQFNILQIDEHAAMAAIPSMLPFDPEVRAAAVALIRQIMGARGDLSETDEQRMAEVARLFAVDESGAQLRAPVRGGREELQAAS